MRNFKLIFAAVGCGLWSANSYAVCLQQNLTQCLDSACAINIGVNPGARCQLCGTAGAGDESGAKSGMTQLTLGASSKNILTATQLKSAPTSPNERYAWAINECIKKIDGCTIDDTQNYDGLIEQSCRAAGIDIQMSGVQDAASVTKDAAACKSTINSCVLKGCGTNFANCRDDADFNRTFSGCSIAATGCINFSAELRTANMNTRDAAIKGSDSLIASIVAGYQSARATKISSATADCTNDSAYNECVESVCENNMKNKCAVGFPSETSMANQLCKFQKTACERLN